MVQLSSHLAYHAWRTAGEGHAVAADAPPDSQDEPEFRPHGDGATGYEAGHAAVLSHTCRLLTGKAWQATQTAHHVATVVEAGQQAGAPVTVASSDDRAATCTGHLLRHYRRRRLRHSAVSSW